MTQNEEINQTAPRSSAGSRGGARGGQHIMQSYNATFIMYYYYNNV